MAKKLEELLEAVWPSFECPRCHITLRHIEISSKKEITEGTALYFCLSCKNEFTLNKVQVEHNK